MQIEVRDVDHGQCVVLTGPTGQTLMLDCGRSLVRPWFPSITYMGKRIDTLIALNLDEDHVADLPGLWKDCSIGGFCSNPTVTAQHLAAMKSGGGMGRGVKQAHEILQRHGPGGIGDWTNGLGGIAWQAFHNVAGQDFTDTNNLSLAVFVRFCEFTILFGGDLEKEGWLTLLRNPAFRTRLSEVKVYVASHHGRDNGCCHELFQYMRPELVIFSDGQKQYETQETIDWYRVRAKGKVIMSQASGLASQPLRKVLTTRRDGSIRINVGRDGSYSVLPEKARSPELTHLNALAGLVAANPLGLRPISSSKPTVHNAFSQLPHPNIPPVASALGIAVRRFLGS